MTDPSPLGNRTDLPAWAEAHWPALLAWALVGLSPEEQLQCLRAQGLTPERALRLALAVPPPTPRGQLARVRLGARLLAGAPGRFWPVVESLQVYWGIHPWSILGEPLPQAFRTSWTAHLGAPGSLGGLRFCGLLGGPRRLPPCLCTSRIQVDQHPLERLPEGWIVEDLVLSACPNLRGSLAEVTVLRSGTVSQCPKFDYKEELEVPGWGPLGR